MSTVVQSRQDSMWKWISSGLKLNLAEVGRGCPALRVLPQERHVSAVWTEGLQSYLASSKTFMEAN